LEEVSNADLLLHLVDLASPQFEEQIEVAQRVLAEIGAGDIATVLVPNKIDAVDDVPLALLKNHEANEICPISALTGHGIDRLLATVGAILDERKERFQGVFSQAQGALIAILRERGRIVQETYQGDGIHVTAMVTPKLAGQMRKLLNGAAVRFEH
ncbi:MAG TPA: GTPase HflX, partial [Candidatus Binatia bacterium]